MKTQTLVYLALLGLCVLIGGLTLIFYYSQDFTETFSFTKELRLADVRFEVYDQNTYDGGYDCRYNELGAYVCNHSAGSASVQVLQSARAVIGAVDLKNEGIFTKIYEAPRLLGCIEFESYETSNGLRFPKEVTIGYQKEGDLSDTSRTAYGVYGGPHLEIAPGQRNHYDLVAHYTPYSIPLSDFTQENIRHITVYVIPPARENPLADYEYTSFVYNPTCESALTQNIEPAATIPVN